MHRLTTFVVVLLVLGQAAFAQELADGTPLDVVATGTDTTLYGMVINDDGHLFIGNNSNSSVGPTLKTFDPTLFTGAPILLGSLGPALGDGDGITIAGGDVLVPDIPEGVWRIPMDGSAATIALPGVGIGANGSPVAHRDSDGHVFVGRGNTQPHQLFEYDALGTLIATHATSNEVQLIAIDQASGALYYTPYTNAPTNVYEFRPGPEADIVLGVVGGPIAAIAYNETLGHLMLGTGTALQPGIPGLVERLDVGTGFVQTLASGFPECRGVAFDVVNDWLYVLSASGGGATLYRASTLGLPDVWTDLGHSLSGITGDPQFTGAGTLLPSTPLVLTLTNAAPSAVAYLVFGFADLSAPFMGGVLVPDLSPPGAAIQLSTDLSGQRVLAATWPSGVPSGFTTYFQYWIMDAAAPQGFAASNGMSGTTP